MSYFHGETVGIIQKLVGKIYYLGVIMPSKKNISSELFLLHAKYPEKF